MFYGGTLIVPKCGTELKGHTTGQKNANLISWICVVSPTIIQSFQLPFVMVFS